MSIVAAVGAKPRCVKAASMPEMATNRSEWNRPAALAQGRALERRDVRDIGRQLTALMGGVGGAG